MTGENLISMVSNAIQDDYYDEDTILSILNEAVYVIAGEIRFPALCARETVETVVGEYSVPLPESYNYGLYHCFDSADATKQIEVEGNIMALLESGCVLGDPGDNIIKVCVDGNDLVYFPTPDTPVELVIRFYRKPDELKLNTSPDFIPIQFHRLLYHYACYIIFDEIEDGEEGNKVNTLRHEGKFKAGMDKLSVYFKEGVAYRRIPEIKGNW